MNGRSLPAPDAPVGSATVRVMRETLGNNVVGQEVTLTDANGVTHRHAQDGRRGPRDVRGPQAGHRVHRRCRRLGRAARLAAVHAAAVGRRARRAGRRAGRGRRRLRACAPPAAGRRSRAPAGSVTLGTQSRMIVEQADEFVEVFVLADLVEHHRRSRSRCRRRSSSRRRPVRSATAVLEGSTGAALEQRPHRGEGAAALRADRRSSSATGCPATAAA